MSNVRDLNPSNDKAFTPVVLGVRPCSLLEKMMILKAGLDDRVVEIVKCVAFLNLHERI